jgi:hypothetical protein
MQSDTTTSDELTRVLQVLHQIKLLSDEIKQHDARIAEYREYVQTYVQNHGSILTDEVVASMSKPSVSTTYNKELLSVARAQLATVVQMTQDETLQQILTTLDNACVSTTRNGSLRISYR